LEDRRKNPLTVFTDPNEDLHHTLSRTYDEIIEDRELVTVVTRAATRGELISVLARKSMFNTSFLPQEIREMRGESEYNYNN